MLARNALSNEAMDILYLLIPMSVLLVLAVLGLFAWAVGGGQFDDLEREGTRVLEEDCAPLDPDQDAGSHGIQESNRRS